MNRLAIFAIVVAVCAGVAASLLFPASGPTKRQSEEGISDMNAVQRDAPVFSISHLLKKMAHFKDIGDYRAEIKKDPFAYDDYEMSEKYYGILGPDLMLDVLEEDPHCHLKSHNLGRLIYLKSDRNLQQALTIGGSRCTFGAFHGILAQVLDDETGTTTTEHIDDTAVVRVAETFCDRPEVHAQANVATCVHSIGHAFMLLMDNDIRLALDECKVFPTEIRQYYCATGVFMQREKVSSKEDAFSKQFPCDTYEHPAACYRYKLRDVYPFSSFKEAHVMCESLPAGAQRNGCYHGLGFTYYLTILNKPSLLTQLCSSVDMIARRMCVEGVASRLEIYYEKPSVLPVCDAQSDLSVRRWCTRALFAGTGFGINKNSDNISDYYEMVAP